MQCRAVDFHDSDDGDGQRKGQQEPVDIACAEWFAQFLTPYRRFHNFINPLFLDEELLRARL